MRPAPGREPRPLGTLQGRPPATERAASEPARAKNEGESAGPQDRATALTTGSILAREKGERKRLTRAES